MDGVVEGSALVASGRVRITVQLIEAATDRSLWAHSYKSELTDILTLQSEVARPLEHLGRHAEAVAELKAGMSVTAGAETSASTGLATLLAAAGRRDEALRMIQDLVALMNLES